MSAVDVSSKLGEYMLKGWILTDEICPNEGCPVPLLRSPKGRVPTIMFCANCRGDPPGHGSPSHPMPSQPREPSPSFTHSSSTHLSRSSTPPTDISSTLSSPTFAPPVETAESIRRRRQSDAASAEIGKRLLKGWAMLADECPNERCYGVPLVRPPLVGGRDPRKECVACGTTYVDEKDAMGWDRLVAVGRPASLDYAAAAGPSSSILPTTDSQDSPSMSSQARGKGKLDAGTAAMDASDRKYSHSNSAERSLVSVLRITTASLELALHSLSQRLVSLSNQSASVEPIAIGNTADAMSKVLQALVHAERLCGGSRS